MNPQLTISLFQQLLNAEDENQVDKIIKGNQWLRDNSSWFPYGGKNKDDKGNFATFENQQPDAIPALIEKITNSIDAILLRECLLRGMDPKSDKAPSSMSEAVNLFFGIKNGDFSEIGQKQRRLIASNIQIIASGDKETPSILIYDDGEGQHPKNFKNTFLSLHRNNKASIPFVQGKYNMGSTGAVVFCGNNRYQLIASRRNPKLLKAGEEDTLGFTLVRKHPLTEAQEEQFRFTWYEYFVIDDNIPSIPIKNLPRIELIANSIFTSGSLVKLYSYNLPRGYTSDVTVDLWRALNHYLYQPALPFLISDTRYKYSAKHESKLVLGNKTRIVVDDRDKKERDTLSSSWQTQPAGKISMDITVFKEDVKNKEFIDKKAVVFTVNGQVHGTMPRTFISQDVGFSFLRDSILVHVDCSDMKTSFRQNLFQANRATLRNSPEFTQLKDMIIDRIKGDKNLKDLNEKRKQGILSKSDGDEEEMLQSILSSIKLGNELIELLKRDGKFKLPFTNNKTKLADNNGSSSNEKPKASARFPSIFKIDLKQDSEGRAVKSIPLNGKGYIEFTTDVEDEYLFRPHDKGEFEIQMLDVGENDVSGGTDKGKPRKVVDSFDVDIVGPTEGSIRVALKPQSSLSVGDEIALNARLSSPDGDKEAIFFVKIIKPNAEKEVVKEKVEPELPAMPNLIKVFESDWKKHNIESKDVIKVYPASKHDKQYIDAIAVNMDCGILKQYLLKNRVKSAEVVKSVQEKFVTSVFLHSLFLYSILESEKKEPDSELTEADIDNTHLLGNIMQKYADFLLYKEANPQFLKYQEGD